MTPDDLDIRASLLGCTMEIVCAFVSHNAIPAAGLPDLIVTTFAAVEKVVVGARKEPETQGPPVPAIAVNKSVTDDYIVCLEDGKKFKSLKRHLRTQFNLSPAEYRAKWGLSSDYPMVAPAYAAARTALAKQTGLGTPANRQGKAAPAQRAA